jgi:hypothetical protein
MSKKKKSEGYSGRTAERIEKNEKEIWEIIGKYI